MLGDFDLAEEVVQDSIVAALEKWPEQGVPDNPGAWLMTTAKRRGSIGPPWRSAPKPVARMANQPSIRRAPAP